MTRPDTEPGTGLQTERTRLAWRRTTLSATATVLLAIVAVSTRPAGSLGLVAVSLMAGGWLVVLVLAHRRIAVLSRSRAAVRWHVPVLTAAVIVALALLAGALLLDTAT